MAKAFIPLLSHMPRMMKDWHEKLKIIGVIAPILAFIVAFFVFVLRRPDIIMNPQFWAEDGSRWFQRVLDLGVIKSLFIPEAGYFQTVSKITMGIATLIPLKYAPLFSNMVALSIRAAPALFLFSKRMSFVPWVSRCLILLYYVLMPNLWEVHANITNSFWYLSLYLFMTIIATAPNSRWWKIHDYCLLLLSGLSSITIIFMAPCYIMKLWTQCDMRVPEGGGQTFSSKLQAMLGRLLTPYSITYFLICLIQGGALILTGDATRVSMSLGLADIVVSNILSSRVFLGSFLPNAWVSVIWDQHFLNYTITIISLVGLIFLLRRGDFRIRGLIIFAAATLLAALARPAISMTEPQLPLLRDAFCGGRYFIIPCIAWFCVVLKLSYHLPVYLRRISHVIILSAVLWMGGKSFTIPPLIDMRFGEYVKKYEDLDKGQHITIPINPGDGWKIEMTKR